MCKAVHCAGLAFLAPFLDSQPEQIFCCVRTSHWARRALVANTACQHCLHGWLIGWLMDLHNPLGARIFTQNAAL